MDLVHHSGCTLRWLEKGTRGRQDGWKAKHDAMLIFVFVSRHSTSDTRYLRTFIPSSKTGLFRRRGVSRGVRAGPRAKLYLANIYQPLANSNGFYILAPSKLLHPTTPFSPPNMPYVNSLRFLGSAICLTCAPLATFPQQPARRSMKVTQPLYSPHKRARIRAFFSEGADRRTISFLGS